MAQKTDKKTLYVSIFIVVIMVSSTLGFILTRSTSSSQNYNGHKFYLRNNHWVLEKDKQEYSFYFHPSELENINLSSSLTFTLQDSPVIALSFNPNASLEYIDYSRFTLAENLFRQNTYVINGITQPHKNYNLSIITCQNATPQQPVLILRKANTTQIREEKPCFYLEASSEYDFIALTERTIYSLLGVMS